MAGSGRLLGHFFLKPFFYIQEVTSSTVKVCVRGHPGNQLTPCISCFSFPIKIAEELFHLGIPFLDLEENPEAIFSQGPPCEWCKPHPMAALNSPPSLSTRKLKASTSGSVKSWISYHHPITSIPQSPATKVTQCGVNALRRALLSTFLAACSRIS